MFKKIVNYIKKGLDMNKKDVYITYSSATNVTGEKLQAALKIAGGLKIPSKKQKLIIGWGAKTDEDVTFPKDTIVLNHPNAIRTNRNKLGALALMLAGDVSIAPFSPTETVETDIASGKITLPLIGRTKYHQGGKGFWVCPTLTHVKDAIKNNAAYFQAMIEIKDEFRFHVFGDTVIYAVKKVQRTPEDFEVAFIEDELARQKKLWEKNNEGPFQEDFAKEILRRQAKNATAGGANMMVRSNKMGWRFSRISKLDKAVEVEAIKAVRALGLDFGAVDCCTDAKGVPFIIEVNTGPGLEGTPFDNYVKAFEALLADKPKAIPTKPISPAANMAAAKTKIGNSSMGAAKKALLQQQLGRLSSILEETPDDEIDTLERLAKHVIFGSDS